MSTVDHQIAVSITGMIATAITLNQLDDFIVWMLKIGIDESKVKIFHRRHLEQCFPFVFPIKKSSSRFCKRDPHLQPQEIWIPTQRKNLSTRISENWDGSDNFHGKNHGNRTLSFDLDSFYNGVQNNVKKTTEWKNLGNFSEKHCLMQGRRLPLWTYIKHHTQPGHDNHKSTNLSAKKAKCPEFISWVWFYLSNNPWVFPVLRLIEQVID